MQTLFNKINIYWRLGRFDQPEDAYLLLWPTLCALFFANDGLPDFKLLVIFTLGTFIMSAAGCIINDFADRNIDKHVERTKNRPLTSGEITPIKTLIFFSFWVILAFLLILFTNEVSIFLACIGLILAIAYPFMKRLIAIPQAWLAIVFSWGIPLAFAATLGNVPHIAWLLLLANAFWIMAFDTTYALDDLAYDEKLNIQSSARFFGKYVKQAIIIFDILAWILFFSIGMYFNRGAIFIVLMLFTAVVFIYNNIRMRNAKEFLPIFINNNYAGIFMFLGVALDYIY